ncbi:hypothetical protein ACHAWF_007076 [Thalassiosira exigua]
MWCGQEPPSKSFVVPKDSSFADPQRPWKGRWMSPSFSKANEHSDCNDMEECVRLEREAAENGHRKGAKVPPLGLPRLIQEVLRGACLTKMMLTPFDDNTLIEAESDRRAALEAAVAALEDTSRSTKIESANNAPVSSALDSGTFTGETADLARLPLQIQFYLTQAEYNARNHDTIPLHLALRDWMALAVPLAHGTWDTASWERGNHRTDDDGYRNEVYMSMLQKCLDAAQPFNFFSERDCFYYPLEKGETKRKRRRAGTVAVPHIVSENSEIDVNDVVSESPLVVVSSVFFSLRTALDMQC